MRNELSAFGGVVATAKHAAPVKKKTITAGGGVWGAGVLLFFIFSVI